MDLIPKPTKKASSKGKKPPSKKPGRKSSIGPVLRKGDDLPPRDSPFLDPVIEEDKSETTSTASSPSTESTSMTSTKSSEDGKSEDRVKTDTNSTEPIEDSPSFISNLPSSSSSSSIATSSSPTSPATPNQDIDGTELHSISPKSDSEHLAREETKYPLTTAKSGSKPSMGRPPITARPSSLKPTEIGQGKGRDGSPLGKRINLMSQMGQALKDNRKKSTLQFGMSPVPQSRDKGRSNTRTSETEEKDEEIKIEEGEEEKEREKSPKDQRGQKRKSITTPRESHSQKRQQPEKTKQASPDKKINIETVSKSQRNSIAPFLSDEQQSFPVPVEELPDKARSIAEDYTRMIIQAELARMCFSIEDLVIPSICSTTLDCIDTLFSKNASEGVTKDNLCAKINSWYADNKTGEMTAEFRDNAQDPFGEDVARISADLLTGGSFSGFDPAFYAKLNNAMRPLHDIPDKLVKIMNDLKIASCGSALNTWKEVHAILNKNRPNNIPEKIIQPLSNISSFFSDVTKELQTLFPSGTQSENRRGLSRREGSGRLPLPASPFAFGRSNRPPVSLSHRRGSSESNHSLKLADDGYDDELYDSNSNKGRGPLKQHTRRFLNSLSGGSKR